ncbi:MAG: alpha/beta hydrolase [Gemmataceae bacterium]|nr:alpha/beta hydrolase [Gemmataceae bacterium]
MPLDDPPPRSVWRRFRESWIGKLLVVYLGVAVMMMFLENRLVYHPSGPDMWMDPPIPDIENVRFDTAVGDSIHGWWLEEPGAARTVLLLHGNGGNLSHRGATIAKFRRLLKASVLIIDYPGYGKSAGSPSETGCYQAADAAYDWLVATQHRDPNQFILFGESLGGGVAVDLASRKKHHSLVLVKTFTTLPDVGARQMRWLPVRWIMRNRFDSMTKLALCKRPVFIAHGNADTLVPIEMGRALYAAAAEPKMFLELPGDGHNDPLPLDFFNELNKFLNENS